MSDSTVPGLTDLDVVARVLAGDTAIFEVLMRRYNQRLFRVARSVVRRDDEAEDIVQQAWVSAFAHLGQFAGTAQFSTWLTRIAIHEALARVRRTNRLSETELEEEEGMEPLNPPPRSPEDRAADRELAALVEVAIDGLPEIYRVVFMLREVQQLSIAESASCLELREETVKVRLHRAKALIRESLLARADSATASAFEFLGARCDRMVATVLAAITDRRPGQARSSSSP